MDCALYVGGVREETDNDPHTLDDTLARLGQGDFLWVGVVDPTHEEMERLGDALGMHPLAVEDTLGAHQRPKVERYSDHVFISMRSVSYSDDDITTNEVNLCLGANYLLTVRHGGPSLGEARHRAEEATERLERGPIAALHAVVDAIVDHYEDVAAELVTDVEEVENSVFSPDRTEDSRRIYRLKRETLEFRHAVAPLRDPISRFAVVAEPEELRPYFRDIADHLHRALDAIDSIDSLLGNALNAHLAQLSVQQNEDMRKLTAGATLFAIPTAVAGVYGMNFEHMPELSWTYGYPACVAAMGAVCFAVYRRFKRSGWL
ncbi:magnesium transport protein CorA [Aeromicrobium flavum]|uniref:Magnesium transport protein CorA n=1 Tax=Aeromicrobium flavum TaxID=416568 RepID=A0A512HUP8_9ACTN|nr:magnesium/cobalt transporter CorA [Aeromicrobium flavum]GEO89177.1 magnesium transport protein CorA [Aeromicrobium flavum]